MLGIIERSYLLNVAALEDNSDETRTLLDANIYKLI
jgi:hypothetical protein